MKMAMNDSDAKRLIALKERIQEATSELHQEEGRKGELLKQLKELGFDSVESAVLGIQELDNSIKDLSIEVDKGIQTLEERYGL